MNQKLEVKYGQIKDIFRSMQGVVVAFSGGIDSSLLGAIAGEIHGESAVLVTAMSPTYPNRELHHARFLKIPHETIETEEFSDPNFQINPPNRCYICKQHLFGQLKQKAEEMGFSHVVEGSNKDDLSDYRPGLQAARDFSIRSPFIEVGFTKHDIRTLARLKGLPGWDKPASACLSSRIPYGELITQAKLSRIERAEDFLINLGFQIVRVRDNETLAILEIGKDEINRMCQPDTRLQVVTGLKEVGYTRIVVDLEGYRTGSMNETLGNNRNEETT